MRNMVVLAVLALAGCGGGGGSSTPPPSGPDYAQSVAISEDSIGCVSAHNADAVIDYVTGTQDARTLLWQCPVYNGTSGAVRVFLGFDYGLQCYTERARARETACTSETALETPVFGIEIESFEATFGYSNGAPGTLSFDIIAANTGNVTAFGTTYAVRPITPVYDEYADRIGYHSGGAENVHYLKTPEEEAQTPWSNGYANGVLTTPFPVYQGDQFTYLIELKDGFGRVFDSRYHHVYAH